MTPEIWTVLLILNKFLVYLGIAAAIGTAANMLLFTHRDVLPSRYFTIRQWQTSMSKFSILFIAIAFIANLFDFFVQVGEHVRNWFEGDV